MPLPLIKLGLAAAAGYYFYNRYRTRATGSMTNASDAMDDIDLGSNPSRDKVIDAGVMETFPASDPVSVNPSETAWEKQERLKKR